MRVNYGIRNGRECFLRADNIVLYSKVDILMEGKL